MHSTVIRLIIAATAFAPILAVSWVIKLLESWNKLTFSLSLSNTEKLARGAKMFMLLHWQILLFFLLLLLSRAVIRSATSNLPMHPIVVKSIKPSDVNLATVLISWILPWGKIAFKDVAELYYLAIFALLCILYAVIGIGSYHYNLNLRIFMGYRHYEIQTKNEVTFLMLSRKKLINTQHIKEYVSLTDHMVINVSSDE